MKNLKMLIKLENIFEFGLNNGYSQEYDDYVDKFTVKKATHEEEERSEGIYNTIFGGSNE